MFSMEGLSSFPKGVPMKLFPEIASRKIRSLLAERRIKQSDVPVLVTAFSQLFRFLDLNMQQARETPPGYLHFVSPFAN